MITPELIAAYRYHRAAHGRPMAAHFAAARARADLAAGTKRYTCAPPKFGEYARPAGSYDSAFFDTLDGSPFRLVGYADNVSRHQGSRRVENTGWYCDLDYSATLRGVVLQLPGRDGAPRFVAGYEESESGGYLVELARGAIFQGDRMGDSYNVNPRDHAAALDAASRADSFAERAAEEEREYQTAWRAGVYYANAAEEIRALRIEALEILAERRAVAGVVAPTLCGVIRAKVESILEEIRALRDKRRELAQGDHGSLIFWPSDKRLAAAFNEGAGARVIV